MLREGVLDGVPKEDGEKGDWANDEKEDSDEKEPDKKPGWELPSGGDVEVDFESGIFIRHREFGCGEKTFFMPDTLDACKRAARHFSPKAGNFVLLVDGRDAPDSCVAIDPNDNRGGDADHCCQ